MSKRRLARENCLQSLYLADITTLEHETILAMFQMLDFAGDDKVFAFYKGLFTSTISNIAKIDDIITTTSRNWSLDRMAAIDRCVLRLAVCEMMFLADAPTAVIIDEAIEMAKKFSTENSGKFVNGVLDSIAKKNNIPPPK